VVQHWILVSEQEAVAHAGTDVELLRGESVTYALGTAATVVILDAGDRPDGSGVRSRDQVVLRGLLPGSVAERLGADHRSDPVVLGFVRLPDGCLPLGRLRFGQGEYVQVGHNDDWPWHGDDPYRLADCLLHLDNLLPWDVLDLARPVFPQPLPDQAWTVHLPHDPVRAMHEFIDGWYADVPAVSAGTANVPLSLPGPLLELYRAAAGRDEVLGRQDFILAPAAVDYVGGRLLFGTENQGGFDLLIDPTGADPEVWYGWTAGELVATGQPLSSFLLQFLLSEAAIVSPFGAFATVANDQQRQIRQLLRRVPLSPMRWPTGPTRHYVGPGIVIMVRDRANGTSDLWAGSRWRSALRPLRRPGFEWQGFSG
jgi:hypothetical protein